MDILDNLQKAFLKEFSKTALAKDFFLTGGTALSAFYLKHRHSEDLDFFTTAHVNLNHVPPILNNIASKMGASIEFKRLLGTFLECFVTKGGGKSAKMDFAIDTPFRLQGLVLNKEYNILIDDELDIACNKVSALFDRAEAKDFVDVFFLGKEFMPFEELIEKAREKHVGIDNYWLAQALFRVHTIEKLPRMIKSIDIPTLVTFFDAKAKSLMDKIKPEE